MVTGKSESEKVSSVRLIRSFEADEDVFKMLDEAKADGLQIGDICNEALRKHGPKIITDMLREHLNSADKWQRRSNSSAPSSQSEKLISAAEGSEDAPPARRRKGQARGTSGRKS